MDKNKKRAYTLSELAKLYDIDRRTFYNWIKPIRQELLDMYPEGINKKYLSLLFPKQVKRIEEYLG